MTHTSYSASLHTSYSALMPVDTIVSTFSLKRRSNPSAAFAEMMNYFLAAVSENVEMAKAFASFQTRFKGVMLTQADAARLAALDRRAVGELGIKVGSWPSVLGAGLAFMYHAGLQALQSTDRPIEPQSIGARAIRVVEHLIDRALPLVGSVGVTALELALEDKGYADKLRLSASELETIGLNNPPAPCEFCVFEALDKQGNVIQTYCGTQKECQAVGTIAIILLIIWLLNALWDWLD